MKELAKTIPSIQDFTAALYRGEQAIREAATILCQMVDSDPKTYEKIHKETGIHWNVLANLERVGRGAMHYKLLFDSSPASKHLISLPQSQQAEAYEKGVRVVTVQQDGKTVVETKKPQELTPAQVKIVFDDKHIRSVDEQITAAKQTLPTERKKPQPVVRYEIKNGKLIVLSFTEFTVAALEEILEQMKNKSVKTLAADLKKNQIK